MEDPGARSPIHTTSHHRRTSTITALQHSNIINKSQYINHNMITTSTLDSKHLQSTYMNAARQLIKQSQRNKIIISKNHNDSNQHTTNSIPYDYIDSRPSTSVGTNHHQVNNNRPIKLHKQNIHSRSTTRASTAAASTHDNIVATGNIQSNVLYSTTNYLPRYIPYAPIPTTQTQNGNIADHIIQPVELLQTDDELACDLELDDVINELNAIDTIPPSNNININNTDDNSTHQCAVIIQSLYRGYTDRKNLINKINEINTNKTYIIKHHNNHQPSAKSITQRIPEQSIHAETNQPLSTVTVTPAIHSIYTMAAPTTPAALIADVIATPMNHNIDIESDNANSTDMINAPTTESTISTPNSIEPIISPPTRITSKLPVTPIDLSQSETIDLQQIQQLEQQLNILLQQLLPGDHIITDKLLHDVLNVCYGDTGRLINDIIQLCQLDMVYNNEAELINAIRLQQHTTNNQLTVLHRYIRKYKSQLFGACDITAADIDRLYFNCNHSLQHIQALQKLYIDTESHMFDDISHALFACKHREKIVSTQLNT